MDRALLLRAVRFARLPGHTIAEACAKYGVKPSAYRKAARELGAEAALHSDEDFLLAGLHSGPGTVEQLIEFYDWLNHSRLGAEEVRAVLQRLIERGMVRQVGDVYHLAVEWP